MKINNSGISASFRLNNLKVTMGDNDIASITADVIGEPSNISSIDLHNLNVYDVQFDLIIDNESTKGNRKGIGV